MKKIAVVTTGGTIGSCTEGGVIRVSKQRNPVLGRALSGVEYDVFSPINILSENANPQTWNRIAQFILDLPWTQYSGIILMHGTDTLCYTGAALAYLLSHTPIPIVLVSAAYEPDDPRSNASVNLQGAADFIRTGGLRGVFAAYSNGGPCLIHLAARLDEITAFGAQLHTCGGDALGKIEGRSFIPAIPRSAMMQFNQPRTPVFSADTPLRNHVALIQTYPGIRYGTIDPTGYSAILHSLYHSGTGCVEGADSLAAFILRCTGLGIHSYFTPAHPGDQYSTTREIIDAGGIPLPAISTPAAYVKLVYFYNTPGASAEILTQDLGFETIEG